MEPLPKSPLGQRLCQVFSYRWASIEGSTEDSTDPKWKTVRKYPLKPRTLWARWNDAAQLVGVRFGNTTKYGLIDIDADSGYLDQIDTIRAALETIGITRTIMVRSSWNGGIHLYIPLPEAVKTFSLAVALKQCLESQGLELNPGQLEIFPNVKAHACFWKGEFTEYNAHRLPLQPGSGSQLLGDDGTPIGEELARFFAMWDNASQLQDFDELEQALRIARDNHRKRPRRVAVHPVFEWRNDLEGEIAEGWTDHGQTNGLLKAIACYGRVFEHLEGDTLATYVVNIATSRPGYSEFCQHQHQIHTRAKAWARAAEKYYWPLGSAPVREKKTYSINEQRRDDARERIRTAAAEVRRSPPATVRQWVARLVDMARCSAETLYKYLELWHPDRQSVTAQPAGIPGGFDGLIDGSPGSDESLDSATVTGDRPLNEGCSLTDRPQNLLTRGERGGAGERGGISTDAT